MKRRVITISREFGSAGRSIGKEVAKRLGIHYYDRDLVTKIVEKTGFNTEFVEENGELSPTKSGLYYALEPHNTFGGNYGLSTTDLLWQGQREVILQLAESEPCVIVGRCADFILKERDDCLHIFIHADMAFREKRIVNLYGETDDSPQKRLKEKDKKRRVHYKHFTGQEWGMAQNYDMTLNSGVLGIEKCVDIIVDIFQSE